MKLKNVFSLLAALVVLCVGAMAVAAPAPSQLGQSRAAIEVAKAEIPANCNLIGYTTKGDESRITFQDPDTLEYYYVKGCNGYFQNQRDRSQGCNICQRQHYYQQNSGRYRALCYG